jgi:adenylate cyclase
VIGDAVNVSSRVEGLTKEYQCDILVTDATVAALADASAFDLQLVAESVKVKGKAAAIGLYRLQR